MVQLSIMKESGIGTGGVGGVGCTTPMGLSMRESGMTTSARGRDCSDWVRNWYHGITFPCRSQIHDCEIKPWSVTQAFLCVVKEGYEAIV